MSATLNGAKPIYSQTDGYRSLMSSLVVSLIQDLGILRRAGIWHDHPSEMMQIAKMSKQGWAGLPSQVRGAYQAGMWQDWYLNIVSALSADICQVEVTPDRIIEAAKRCTTVTRERQYNGHSNPRARAR